MKDAMRLLLPLLALGCTPEPEPEPEPLSPYDAPGPYTAGTSEGTTTGSTGVELPITAWFPSVEDGDDFVRYGGLLAGDALTDVDPACDEPRPVMVFSHGYGGVRYQSPFLHEHLATHGWISVAPDHVGNTFSNNTVPVDEVGERRPTDISDTFDWLVEQSDDPASPLAGCVDASAGYAVAGHSFGGWTAYATGGATVNHPDGGTVSLADSRAWAVVALAPWDADGAITDGTADIAVPVLTLSGELDTTTPWSMVTGMFDAITAEPRRLGRLPEGGHYSFAPVACELLGGNGCGDGFVEVSVATGLTATATLAFLDDMRGIEGAAAEMPAASADLAWDDVAP